MTWKTVKIKICLPSFCTGRIRIHLVLNCETVIRTETHLCWRMWACALKTGPTTAKTKQYISTQPKITVTFSTVSSLPDKNMGRYNSQVPTRMTHIPKKKATFRLFFDAVPGQVSRDVSIATPRLIQWASSTSLMILIGITKFVE